ncbi:hypothetical protein TCON_0383 [Astathelohania contejeani]|uniref:Uncharacterized protein n=1 Tax=Astathelohania contejeani TaxID=164912 RepID=A0ABQ7I1Y0_9MICR|nr:hypothetical protein TCON_0383 [Thelohania contejeani]
MLPIIYFLQYLLCSATINTNKDSLDNYLNDMLKFHFDENKDSFVQHKSFNKFNETIIVDLLGKFNESHTNDTLTPIQIKIFKAMMSSTNITIANYALKQLINYFNDIIDTDDLLKFASSVNTRFTPFIETLLSMISNDFSTLSLNNPNPSPLGQYIEDILNYKADLNNPQLLTEKDKNIIRVNIDLISILIAIVMLCESNNSIVYKIKFKYNNKLFFYSLIRLINILNFHYLPNCLLKDANTQLCTIFCIGSKMIKTNKSFSNICNLLKSKNTNTTLIKTFFYTHLDKIFIDYCDKFSETRYLFKLRMLKIIQNSNKIVQLCSVPHNMSYTNKDKKSTGVVSRDISVPRDLCQLLTTYIENIVVYFLSDEEKSLSHYFQTTPEITKYFQNFNNEYIFSNISIKYIIQFIVKYFYTEEENNVALFEIHDFIKDILLSIKNESEQQEILYYVIHNTNKLSLLKRLYQIFFFNNFNSSIIEKALNFMKTKIINDNEYSFFIDNCMTIIQIIDKYKGLLSTEFEMLAFFLEIMAKILSINSIISDEKILDLFLAIKNLYIYEILESKNCINLS